VYLEVDMDVPTFDVFSGSLAKGALWIRSTDGFGNAISLMNECAKKRPGAYFVFDLHHHKILASVDSSRKPMVPEPPPW
jgi:hypothetical protein